MMNPTSSSSNSSSVSWRRARQGKNAATRRVRMHNQRKRANHASRLEKAKRALPFNSRRMRAQERAVARKLSLGGSVSARSYEVVFDPAPVQVPVPAGRLDRCTCSWYIKCNKCRNARAGAGAGAGAGEKSPHVCVDVCIPPNAYKILKPEKKTAASEAAFRSMKGTLSSIEDSTLGFHAKKPNPRWDEFCPPDIAHLIQKAIKPAESILRDGCSTVIVLVMAGSSPSFCPYVLQNVLSNLEQRSSLKLYVVTLGVLSFEMYDLARTIRASARTRSFTAPTVGDFPAVMLDLKSWIENHRTVSCVRPPFRFDEPAKLCRCINDFGRKDPKCKCWCSNGKNCGCPYDPDGW